MVSCDCMPPCETTTRIYALPLRLFGVILLVFQSTLLDYYLATYIDSNYWFLWSLFDSLVVVLFITSFTLSYRLVSPVSLSLQSVLSS